MSRVRFSFVRSATGTRWLILSVPKTTPGKLVLDRIRDLCGPRRIYVVPASSVKEFDYEVDLCDAPQIIQMLLTLGVE